MIDLYPQESRNFVFGQAMAGRGLGVFSFARYDPSFYEDIPVSLVPSDVTPQKALMTLYYSLVYPYLTYGNILWANSFSLDKQGHISKKHCVYGACAMNGSNTLEESNRRPAFLCPVCLVKLYQALQCPLGERYQ
ncbi:predicted protein, partial [Nematostella vectensis]